MLDGQVARVGIFRKAVNRRVVAAASRAANSGITSLASISFLDYQRDQIRLSDLLLANGFPGGKCLLG
jgi:hypothetical protein